jgi:hypothetical protein
MSEQNRDARPLATAAQRIYPTVRAISFADVNEAWAQGLRDFCAAPVYGLVFGGIYAAGGIVVVLGATALGLGSSRVIRSGSWKNDQNYVRPSNRDNYDPNVR